MKNIFYSVALIAMLFFQTTYTKNIHSTLILHKKHNAWFFDSYEIRKNPEASFEAVIEKWQRWLDRNWRSLSSEICESFNISEADFTGMLKDEQAQALYNQIIVQPKIENKRSRILAFIKHSLRQHTKSKFKVAIDSEMSHATKNIGASPKHFVLCSPDFFSQEHIDYIHDKSPESSMYFSPQVRKDGIACINMQPFVLYIVAATASHINHDKDFFSHIVHFFTLNGGQISKKTQLKFEQFCHIRSALEGVFQSSNPLEVALFLKASVEEGSPYTELEIILWGQLIEDLKTCYHPEDLDEYNQYMAPNLEIVKARSPFQ